MAPFRSGVTSQGKDVVLICAMDPMDIREHFLSLPA